MKEFTNPRELIGQIGLDLEAKAGQVGSIFRQNIREELDKLSKEKQATVSIRQTAAGSFITLKIEDWVDKLERTRIEEEFKDLMDRLGANKSGTCCGMIPSNLASFLRQGA